MCIFVVSRVPGPAWDHSRPMCAQAGWDDHARFMDHLEASGFIIMGGPLEGGDQEFLFIMTAEDEQAVRQTLARDPWEPAGRLITHGVRAWAILLDSRKPA